MANEAIVFSMTTTNGALDDAKQAGSVAIDVADEDTATVTASVDLALYALKTKYNGTDGKSKLLLQLDKIRAKIVETSFPFAA